MAEDTDRVEGDGAANGEAGAFPAPPFRTLQGVGAVARAGSFNSQAFNSQGFNDATDAANLQLASPPPVSPEPPLTQITSVSAGGLESGTAISSASAGSLEARGEARGMAAAFGGMSGTVAVDRVSPEPLPPETTVILERRLSERREDIRHGARTLARAIEDQIDRLNTAKPNAPDALAVNRRRKVGHDRRPKVVQT